MSKFENELDLNSARKSVLKQKDKIDKIFSENKDLIKIAQSILDNPKIFCYIFSKSVAFRIGKSSVKTINGFPSGFKTSFSTGQTAISVFNNFQAPTTLGKTNTVILLAAWFLINNQERVKSESDKTEAVESEQVAATDAELKRIIQENGSIKIMVGDELFDVDDIKQVSGRPKADIVLTNNGKDAVFISHKKGSKPADFQQYGGFTNDLGIKGRADAKKFKSIDKFLSDVEYVLTSLGVERDSSGRLDLNKLKKGFGFARLIDDSSAVNLVMFGKDYNKNVCGLDNCSIVIDGDITFSPIDGTSIYRLEGSYHTTVNPILTKSKKEINISSTDIYSPVMFLMKSESQGLHQAGFANTRAVIWPNNNIVKTFAKKFDDALRDLKNDRSGAKLVSLKKLWLK